MVLHRTARYDIALLREAFFNMRKPSNRAKHSAFTPHYRMTVAVLGSAVLAVLLYLGILRQQPTVAEEYPIQGFDGRIQT